MALHASRPGVPALRTRDAHRVKAVQPLATAVSAVKQGASIATSSYSGKGVSGPANGKHFLHLDDFSKEDLLDMLDRAKFAKAKVSRIAGTVLSLHVPVGVCQSVPAPYPLPCCPTPPQPRAALCT